MYGAGCGHKKGIGIAAMPLRGGLGGQQSSTQLPDDQQSPKFRGPHLSGLQLENPGGTPASCGRFRPQMVFPLRKKCVGLVSCSGWRRSACQLRQATEAITFHPMARYQPKSPHPLLLDQATPGPTYSACMSDTSSSFRNTCARWKSRMHLKEACPANVCSCPSRDPLVRAPHTLTPSMGLACRSRYSLSSFVTAAGARLIVWFE